MCLKYITSISLFCFFTFQAISQVKGKSYYSQEKGKWGLIKIENGLSDTLYPAAYTNIVEVSNGYLLPKSKIARSHFKDVVWTNSEFNTTNHFEEIIGLNDYFIQVKNKSGYAYFDIKKEKYILENCKKFDARALFLRDQNNKQYSLRLFIFDDGKNAGILSGNGKVLIQQPTKTAIDIRSKYEYILVGKKVYDIYDLSGKLVEKGVREMASFCGGHSIKGLTRLTFEDGSQSVYIRNRKLFGPIEGDIKLDLLNPNRFRVWNSEGFTIIDSTGKVIVPSPMETVYAVTKNTTYNYRPNLVQIEDKWQFVDNNFMPISNEQFDDAYVAESVLDWDYVYLITNYKNETPESFLYSSYGQKIIDSPIESITTEYNDVSQLFIAEKKGKVAFSFNGVDFTDFVFEDAQLIPNYEHAVAAGTINGEMQILLPEDSVGAFKGENIQKAYITHEEMNYNQLCLNLHKGNSKTFSVAFFDQSAHNYQIFGDYKIQEVFFGEDFTYSHDGEPLRFKKEDKWGIFGLKHKKVLIEPKYDEIILDWEWMDYGYSYIKLIQDKKIGILIFKKDTVFEFVSPIYDEIKMLEESILVKKDGLWGIVNHRTGKEVLKPCLKKEPIDNFVDLYWDESMSYPQEAIVNGNKTYCYNNGKQEFYFGEELTMPEWGDETFYYINSKNKIGLIKNNWDTLLPPVFQEINLGENSDLLLTKKDDKYGVRSFHGKVVIEEIYDQIIQNIGLDGFVITKNNLSGIYLSSSVSLPVEYNQIIIESGEVFAQKGEFWYYFDYNLKQTEKEKAKTLKEFQDILYSK